MKTRPHWLCLPILALGIVGCMDVKNHYVLNPDGSGKVIHEATVQPMSFTNDGSDPERLGRDTVKQLVEESEGVDTWTDVSFTVNDDSTVTLKGTAYFQNLNSVNLNSGGMKSDSNDFVLSTDVHGISKLAFYEDSKEDETDSTKTPVLSDDELTAEIAKAKSQYKQGKTMMAAMLGSMRIESKFQLPGTIKSSHNVSTDENTALVVFDGNKVIEAMDAVYADEAWLGTILKAGKDPMSDKNAVIGDTFNEVMFGASGPVEVSFDKGTTPQFDYAGESEAARAGLEAMLADIGIQAPTPIQAAPGGGFTNVMVGGVQWVRYEDQENEIRPLNSQKGFQLSVIAELGGAALSVEEGTVTEAIADNGESLLPESEWNRKINFPRLSKNKDKVVFEISLSAPGDKVQGIQKVVGQLNYTVGSTTKEIDLGVTSLTPGQKGTEFNTSIEKVGKSQWTDGYDLSIKLDINNAKVKELQFFDGSGKKLTVNSAGYSGWGDSTEFTYSSDQAFPTNGKVMALVYDDLVVYQADFTLQNLDLLGNPL